MYDSVTIALQFGWTSVYLNKTWHLNSIFKKAFGHRQVVGWCLGTRK